MEYKLEILRFYGDSHYNCQIDAKMLFKTYFCYPCCFETHQTYRFNYHSTYSYSGIGSIERALNVFISVLVVLTVCRSLPEIRDKMAVARAH